MSYEHGTPFINLPQTQGNDKRDWFDTNEAFADLDAKLKTAYESAESSQTEIDEINTHLDTVEGNVDTNTADITDIKSHLATTDEHVATNSTAIANLQNTVTGDKQDLKDSICAIEEDTATAQYRHAVGEYFWYNDTLYKTDVLIQVGQQIVPDVNCHTTNVTTELLGLSPQEIENVVRWNTTDEQFEYNDAGTWTPIVLPSGVEIDDTTTSTTKVWSSQKTADEIVAPKVGETKYNSVTTKMQYWNGTAWVDLSIGGGGMPALDFNNSIELSSGSTIPSDGEIFISLSGIADSQQGIAATITINGKTTAYSTAEGAKAGMGCYNIRVSKNDTVTFTGGWTKGRFVPYVS